MQKKYYKVTLANDYAYVNINGKYIPIIAYEDESGIYEVITKQKLSMDNKYLKYNSLINVNNIDEEIALFVTLNDEEIKLYRQKILEFKVKQNLNMIEEYGIISTLAKKIYKKK